MYGQVRVWGGGSGVRGLMTGLLLVLEYFLLIFKVLLFFFTTVPFECEKGQRKSKSFVADFSALCPSIKKKISYFMAFSDG
jgi:hypothetical protein